MDIEQFKLLRLQNQYLLAPRPSDEVVRGLIGLQAQYGAAALHALFIRSSDKPDYSNFVKTWSFRGTLHLHHKDDLPLVLYRGSETEFGQMAMEPACMEPARSGRFRAIILEALTESDKKRDDLKALWDGEEMTEREAEIIFHPWGGLFRAMAEKGEIAYTADGNRVFTRLAPLNPMEEESALNELMRRYLLHYAPVSLRDAQTFFGIPQRRLKAMLEQTAAESFSFVGQSYYTMGQGLTHDAQIPSVVFLAAFDQMLLGYRKNDNPILPEKSIKTIYNNTGIVFPTVLLDGTVRAIWKRTGNKLELRPLSSIGARDRKRIERKAVDSFGKTAVQWTEQ